MIDLFTKIYGTIRSNKRFLKIRFYSLLRVIIRNIGNIVLPAYIRVSNLFYNYRLVGKPDNMPKINVSLTTFPARVSRVWLVIECMLRQTNLPDKIILWLSREQFPELSTVPKNLLKLQERGLEIVYCEGDLRSHKKYYYSIAKYPEDILITIDDDIFYPSNLIADLVALNKKYPKAICCNRATRVLTENGEILPYIKWGVPDKGKEPSYDVFGSGVGGILYPPGALSNEVLNKDIFMKYCKYADDIWLYIMAQLNNTKIATTCSDIILMPIYNSNDFTLNAINVAENLNDVQLKNVRDYYMKEMNKDPFVNILRYKN